MQRNKEYFWSLVKVHIGYLNNWSIISVIRIEKAITEEEVSSASKANGIINASHVRMSKTCNQIYSFK